MSSTRQMAQQALLERLDELEGRLQEQQDLISAQNNTIEQLQTTYTPPPSTSVPGRGTSCVKSPSILFYNGEGEQRTSSKVKSFLFNVKGKLVHFQVLQKKGF